MRIITKTKLPFALTFLLLTAPALSFALPNLDCGGLAIDRTNDTYHRTVLKTVDYDPYYREGEVLHYALGADDSYLPNEGIGLIIYDKKTDRAVSNVVGFRRIGETKFREASLQLYDYTADQRHIVVTVRCSYREP